MNVHVLRLLRSNIFRICKTALIVVLTFGTSQSLLQAQTCAPIPSGLVSWWQAEGNPSDSIGGNDGTIVGNVTYAAGEVGQAFSLDGNHSGLTLGSPANLQLQNFTIDAWIKRGNITHASLDTGGGVLFGYGLSGYQLGMFDNGKLFLANVGSAAVSSTVQVTDTAWHHVAVAKNGTTVVFYLDGAPNPASAFSTTFQFFSAVDIGALPGSGPQNSFLGLIDELDVFDHALSATEVQGIYTAGSLGKCTGNMPPTIVAQPVDQTIVAGNAASFSVTVSGSQPISYQWQLNGANLPGATSSTLNLVNVQTANAGNYSAFISSPFGSTNSASALLTVNPAPVCSPAPSGLISWWQAEGNATDAIGGNNGTLSGNVTPTNGEVGLAFKLDGNRSGITVGNPVNLQVQDFTIDAWVNRGSATQTSVDPGGGIVFSYGSGGYQLGILDDGRPFLSLVGAASQLVIGTVQVTGTSWHHVAVTKTGSSVVFYLDGVANPVAAFGPASFQFTTTATIGSVINGGSLQNSFQGSIDELDIFNRALSAAEVQSIFNAGTLGKCPLPPVITTQPSGQSSVVGGSASFSVAASGSQPFGYQWQLNGVNLAGATSSTLNLANIQTTDSGNYSVIVSNPYGSTNSASVLLTVNNPTCVPAPSGLVSWWQGEGNTTDFAGGNSGTVGGNVTYTAGEVGQAFNLDGNHSGVTVGNAADLQLQDFTIDAWIKRGSATKASQDTGGGVVFGYGTGGYQFAIADNGQMFLDQVGTPGQIVASSVLVADTAWHHVAMTKSGLVVNFYLDGVLSPGPAMSVAFTFTTSPAIGAQGASLQNSFLGSLDEVDVFNRALSAVEVQSIFNARGAGKCGANTPPVITAQPASKATSSGNSISFSVNVGGSQPFSYQWRLNGSDLTDATGPTLNLVNVQTTDSGNYSVFITNPYGSTTSANALLTVIPAGSCTPVPSGLVSWWQGEGNPTDFVGGNNGTVVGNVSYAPGEVGQAFSFNGNHTGVTVGSPANLQLQNFTIDAWVKRGSATQASLDAGGGVLFGYGSQGYQLGMFDNGQLFLTQVAVANQVVTSTVQVADTAWHHIAVTRNGTVVVFYVDGLDYPAAAYNAVFGFGSTATIGSLLANGLQNSFLGLIDELDVFNRALSTAEVQAIYSVNIAGKCTGNTPPAITAQPANQTTIAGSTASFSVTAAGSQPLSYQWQLNGANLSGATSQTLNLNNVQTANAGNYSVIVSNPYGSITSANALLTVNTPICTLAPSGLVSWWQGEGNTTDFAGGNSGTVGGNVTYTAGEVGQAFNLDGNHSGVTVGNAPNLQLQNFTIDAWVKRSNAAKASLDTGGGVVFGYGITGYQFAISDSGQLFLDQVGTPGQIVSSTAVLTDTAWHHVAVTKNSLTVVFYVDGVTYPAAAMSVLFGFTTSPAIGASGSGFQNSFLGSLDEVDVFSRPLSAAEIQSIFNARAAGKCGANTPPMITTQPAGQTTVIGNSISFTVTAGGSQPFTYQWRYNGANLPGATSQTLNLVNAQTANAGNYSVVISNPFGSATSANALLTVNPSGSCTPAPSGLVSWWQGDASATDLVGGNNGTLAGNVTYAAGEVGLAFSLDGSQSGVTVGNPANLQLQNFTIDAWVKRGSATQASQDAGGGVVFGYGTGGYQFAIADTGQLLLDQVGVSGQVVASTVQVADTAWHHVAVTKNAAVIVFYLDGVAYPGSAMNVGFGFTTPATIGASGSSFQNSFLGLLDEVDVFNRDLSGLEVQSIYNAGIGGKCTGNTAPVLLVQPAAQTIFVGNSTSFSVTAAGSQPLSYQWQLNGTNLPGATSPVLNLINVQATQTGNYSVIVNNPYGSITSPNALLTVNPLTCIPPPSGLVSWWQAEGNAVDFTGGNNGSVIGNVTYAPGEVGQAFNLDGNHSGFTVGNPANLQLQNFTIDAWVKRGSTTRASLDNGGGVVFGYGGGGYQLGMFDNGQLFLEAVGSSLIASAFNVADTAWHHIAVSKDGSLVVFYLDGVATPAVIFNPTFQFTSTAAIGGLLGGSLQNTFLGSIDELDIFNRGLSAAEVQSVYNSGVDGKCNGSTPPSIVAQPANQTTLFGNTASFSVTATGSRPLSYQWQLNGTNVAGATGSTLNLVNVQNTDAGNYSVIVSSPYGSVTSASALLTVNPVTCTPAPSGLVSWWQGEGNAIDATGGNNGTLSGNVTYTPGRVGQAFSLDGNHSGITVGNPVNLQLQDFTIDAWVKRGSATQASLDTGGGVIFGYGSVGYQFAIADNGQMFLDQVGTPGQIVNSTVQVTDTAWHHVAMTKTGLVVTFYLDGVVSPGPAMSVLFGFNTPATIGAQGAGFQNSFLGLIDELDVFNRALSASEVQGIYNAGIAGKCALPPSILTQPASQTATVGGNVTFTVTTGGTSPLTYQWTFGGANIPGATSSSLTLANVQINQAGNYAVVVASGSTTITSSPATLTVILPPSQLQIASVTHAPGIITVPINVIARGDENALGFSINYDKSLLTFVEADPGSGAIGASMFVNTNLTGSGQLGIAMSLPFNTSFAPGTLELAEISFSTAPVTKDTVTPVTFGDQPILRQVSNPQAVILPATYTDGGITITFPGFEADVSPRPTGDNALTIIDWVQVGRFVAGLDTITNASEFQRADCAPRATSGNGVLTVADWVQAGRYVAGLDPLTYAGGPTGPTPMSLTGTGNSKQAIGKDSLSRTLTVVNTTAQAGQACQVPIQLSALGNENGLEFSVVFNAAALSFTGATVGNGATGASLIVNTNQAASGQVGVVLALPTGANFAASKQQVVKLNFLAAPSAGGSSSVSFTTQPLPQQAVDSTAADLPITYIGGSVAITPQAIASPTLTATYANGGIVLSWPASAAGFNLESNPHPTTTNWSGVSSTLITNGTTITTSSPISGSQMFFRLHHP